MTAPVLHAPGVHETLHAVAAHGLPGSLRSWPARPLPPHEWSTLLGHVRRHRLAGLLVAALAAEQLPATQAQSDEAALVHLEAMEIAVRLEAVLLEVVGSLEHAGLDVRVIKGTATAHLDYPDPALRLFGDLDLLVRSDEYDDVLAVLCRDGARRSHPEPRRGFERRYSKGVTVLRADGVELDVHRTFVVGPFGLRLDLETLWAPAVRLPLGGATVPVLPLEQRALNACYNAAIGQTWPKLASQRDVAQTVLHPELDVGLFLELVRRSQAEPVVARAVRATWDALALADLTRLSEWARSLEPSRLARRELALHDSESVSYTAQCLASVRALPALDKLRFLTALAFPDQAFAAAHAGRLTLLSRGLRDLRSLRSAQAAP